LCGHAFSASSINKRLGESLAAFAERPLHGPFPYLILDARYEKVREAGVVMSQAVLVRRHRLGRAAPDPGRRDGQLREPLDLLVGLKVRGLRASNWVVSDDHAGWSSPSAR
jgi:transposase-like protein